MGLVESGGGSASVYGFQVKSMTGAAPVNHENSSFQNGGWGAMQKVVEYGNNDERRKEGAAQGGADFFLFFKIFTLSPGRLCRKSVHGSTSSPRTDKRTLEVIYLAVRPEPVEGPAENCVPVFGGRGYGEGDSG